MNAKEAYEASMRRLEARTKEDLDRAHARIVEAIEQGQTEACLHGKVMPSTLEALATLGYKISGPGDTDMGSVYVRWAHVADEPSSSSPAPKDDPDALYAGGPGKPTVSISEPTVFKTSAGQDMVYYDISSSYPAAMMTPKPGKRAKPCRGAVAPATAMALFRRSYRGYRTELVIDQSGATHVEVSSAYPASILGSS